MPREKRGRLAALQCAWALLRFWQGQIRGTQTNGHTAIVPGKFNVMVAWKPAKRRLSRFNAGTFTGCFGRNEPRVQLDDPRAPGGQRIGIECRDRILSVSRQVA